MADRIISFGDRVTDVVAVADPLRIMPSGATGRTLIVGEMTLSGT